MDDICPKCESRDVERIPIKKELHFRCRNCGLWYEQIVRTDKRCPWKEIDPNGTTNQDLQQKCKDCNGYDKNCVIYQNNQKVKNETRKPN